MKEEHEDKGRSIKLAITYHDDFSIHGYPVLRDRVAPAFDELVSRGLLDRDGVEVIEARPAEEDLAGGVHSETHIKGVISSGYYEVALLSAGAVIQGAEEVATRRAANSFCFTGTAGHHASRDGFWGFCYLNDVAMAIVYLRERRYVRRFSIIDIDPHFGDGTRDILGSDPDVMHINFHSGYSMGSENGPNNIDFSLPYDADDERFLADADEAIKVASSFGHDVLFIVFGHDNHDDDYGAFRLSDDVYSVFARKIMKMFPRGVCYVLSGGSNPRVAREAVGGVVEVLSS
ncbi:MAG: histone deacetylase [Actinomycetota bacterium]|nr:histone deacetylase [Actinomycetota bacterium]